MHHDACIIIVHSSCLVTVRLAIDGLRYTHRKRAMPYDNSVTIIMSTRLRDAPLPHGATSLAPCQLGRTGAQACLQVSDHFHTSTTATRPSTGSCGRHPPSAVKRHQENATHSRPPGAPSSPTSTSLSFAPAYAFRPSDMGIAASKRSTATRPVRV
jgi:hypothetical protein